MIKELLSIMTKRQKTATFVLFFVMIINACFELIGIAIVAPVVTILQAQNFSDVEFANKISSNIFSKWTCSIFKINPVTSNASLIITVMIVIIIVIYVIKALYSILVTYLSALFSTTLSRSMSTRLVKANLSMPYDYFVNTNSSIIMQKCNGDVINFKNTVTSILNMLISGLITIAIFTYLMIISWKITLIFSVCMIIGAVLSVYVLKNAAKKTGIKARKYDAKNYDILHRCIYGIKETKIAETDDFFLNQFYSNKLNSDKNSIKYTCISALPSLIVQNAGIIVVMIITVLLVRILDKSQSTFIVSLLSAFVLAAVKLLPNINVISANAVAVTYFRPAINAILRDLNEAKDIEIKKQQNIKIYGNDSFEFKKGITIKNLNFAYKYSKNIVENVNLSIEKGDYVAFSGDSGAGKTTLVDNLLGLLTPQTGNIFCDNRSIYENSKSWHKLLSYVPQTIFLLDDTIKANVCFGLREEDINEDKVWDALNKAQLKEFVEMLPNKLHTKIGEAGIRLSGGQRQRIGIARAFYRDTPIMVLDEATSALDYKTEDNILLNIQKVKGDKTVIIITHRLNTISHCDKIFSIENHNCTQIK